MRGCRRTNRVGGSPRPVPLNNVMLPIDEDSTMNFDHFECLSFDCYGTLIDWETGIASALRPILAAHEVSADHFALLQLFGEAEAEIQA